MKVKTAEKMVPLQVYLPDEQYFELKATAAARGVTMSQIARERVEARLEELERQYKAKAKD